MGRGENVKKIGSSTAEKHGADVSELLLQEAQKSKCPETD